MDILHDNSFRVLADIAEIAGGAQRMPDYVANRELMDVKSAATLEDTQFADPAHRLYPLNSKQAVWLSAAYLEYHTPEAELHKAAAIRDYARDSVMRAARIFAMEDDVVHITNAVKSARLREESDADYALPEKKRFRVTGPEELKIASTFFAEHRASYPQEIRRKVAEFLIKKSAEYNVPMGEILDTVRKEAGFGVPNPERLREELEERAKLAGDEESGALMHNINNLLDVDPCMLSGNIEKIASIITDFDVANGLDTTYGKAVPYPSDILYADTVEKVAGDLGMGIAIGPHVLDAVKVAGVLEEDLLRDSMGKEFTESCYSEGTIDPGLLKAAVDKLGDADKMYFRSVLQLICE